MISLLYKNWQMSLQAFRCTRSLLGKSNQNFLVPLLENTCSDVLFEITLTFLPIFRHRVLYSVYGFLIWKLHFRLQSQSLWAYVDRCLRSTVANVIGRQGLWLWRKETFRIQDRFSFYSRLPFPIILGVCCIASTFTSLPTPVSRAHVCTSLHRYRCWDGRGSW